MGLLHQLMELGFAVTIGYTFRARPFSVLFQQVRQVALELADQLLPAITTVEINPHDFQNPNMSTWKQSMVLEPSVERGGGGGVVAPSTLIVLNPGDSPLTGDGGALVVGMNTSTMATAAANTAAAQAVRQTAAAAAAAPPPNNPVPAQAEVAPTSPQNVGSGVC